MTIFDEYLQKTSVLFVKKEAVIFSKVGSVDTNLEKLWKMILIRTKVRRVQKLSRYLPMYIRQLFWVPLTAHCEVINIGIVSFGRHVV